MKHLIVFFVLFLIVGMGIPPDMPTVTPNHQRLTKVICCHCVSYLSNGQRFYHGVLPISYCLAQGSGAHCEGEAPCPGE